MRRLWMLAAMLLTLILLLVRAGQGGQRLWQVSAVGWLLLAVAAMVQWLRTRQPGSGLYTLGLVAMALSSLARFDGFRLIRVAVLLHPLYPLGLALAAAIWARGPQRSLPRLSQVLVGWAVALAALSWLYYVTFNWHGGTVRVAATLTLLVGLGWALVAVVAWRGYRNSRLQPLLWLGAQGAIVGLDLLLTSASMLGAHLPPETLRMVYPVIASLPLAMAIGVVWTVEE